VTPVAGSNNLARGSAGVCRRNARADSYLRPRLPQISRWQLGVGSSIQTRGKKTKTTVNLADLPQGPLVPPTPTPAPSASASAEDAVAEENEGPAYPTVVLQARRNMQKFENCVLLTRVGGFYELYFQHAEEYGPLLNIKVAQKKTSAGPIPMAGFPFFQLDRFLKVLVQDYNCYVAVAEEFPNDPGDKVKTNGLMHDRRVTRIITPGTLIDENFIDPLANNYVMAIHTPGPPGQEKEEKGPDSNLAKPELNVFKEEKALVAAIPLGLAWLDVSTGQFYTQTATIGSLSSVLSRISPREIIVDKALQSDTNHALFAILAEDKHLISYSPHPTPLALSEWTPMLESEIPPHTLSSLTEDETQAGSLLLQYVRDRLIGLSVKLQPPIRHESMHVMTIDKNSMRSLEIKQTIRDSLFRGSLLHAIRRTVTKSGARLLNEWLIAPSTSLDTIEQRQDLVEYFLQNPDLRDEIVQLLRRSHDSQRLVQKFAFGRGDPDDLIGLANTIRTTESIVKLLKAASKGKRSTNAFADMLSRMNLIKVSKLADRIRDSIDEEGVFQKHELEDQETSQLLSLAEGIVSTEGSAEETTALLPKSPKLRKKPSNPTSIRDHYADDNLSFIMKPGASPGLRDLHAALESLLHEKAALTDELRARFGAASLTLRWTPNLGHICHVRGVKDTRRLAETAPDLPAVSSSRSTRAFHAPEWTRLGQRIHQTRFQMQTEETRLFSELRAQVVLHLVRLRRNAAVLDELDVTTSFARLATEQGLTRPQLRDDSGDSSATLIIGGRHPTVEGGLHEQGRTFTSNDCLVGVPGHGRLWLITGPNMAGKSTYLRQNALITILAQVGCYVPAHHAELGIVDAIFSRVGSADNLYRDQSTFMVEMLETAQILRAATPRSFVIMDEIGRGTAPEDGTAVAFASLHHLVTINKCRTLFATHFHSLADMVEERGMHVTTGGHVEIYCTDVEEDDQGGFVYIHKLRKGINRESHALKVARLAGIPEAAINVAKQILETQVDPVGWGKSQGAVV
ncbi:MutS2 protein, partial [Apiospora saccharicola]